VACGHVLTSHADGVRTDGPRGHGCVCCWKSLWETCQRLEEVERRSTSSALSTAQVQSCGQRPLPLAASGGFFFTLARECGVRALALTLTIEHTHPPPIGPRRNPKWAVLDTRKTHSAFRPQGSGQMPPRQPCRPDRDACGPASRPSCRVGMSPLFRPKPAHRPW